MAGSKLQEPPVARMLSLSRANGFGSSSAGRKHGKNAVKTDGHGEYEDAETDVSVVRRGPLCMHVVKLNDRVKQAEINAKGLAERLRGEKDSCMPYKSPEKYPVQLEGTSAAMAACAAAREKQAKRQKFLKYTFQSLY